MTVSRALLDKGNKLDWQTPTKLWQELDDEFHFELDACTTEDNPLNTPIFYTEKVDGLKSPWVNTTYCNPPYGRYNITKWLDKGLREMCGGITSVFLLPARTSTIWFHSYIWDQHYHVPQWNREVRFLKGRLSFRGSGNSAPFDSMIVVFHGAK